MADHAVSFSPAVQAQLDRLASLSPGADVLGLTRITALLDRLGNPERRLPPVFHVAGTNGKGSTCAFLRAMLEASGRRAHVYTSPHLVRFNERIRLAGRLIDDDLLAELLRETLDAGGDVGASFFEVTTAAAFLAFTRVPADACVIEVGLGGRLDATNIVSPLIAGIASLGIDHEAFLLAEEAGTPAEPLSRIGFEKAGIAKPGAPLVTQHYPPPVAQAIAAVADTKGALLRARGEAWHAAVAGDRLIYRDAAGDLDLPLPALAGEHQAENAALAVAMLRQQHVLPVTADHLARGITAAYWPARLQRLSPGPLTAGRAAPLWLDGGHNPDAGRRLAAFFADVPSLDLVLGMLANKDPAAILAPLAEALGARLRSVRIVPIPGHDSHPIAAFAAMTRDYGIACTAHADVAAALAAIATDAAATHPHAAIAADTTPPADAPAGTEADAVSGMGPKTPFPGATSMPPVAILIAGSLYLAGAVLAANDEPPG